MNTRWITRSGEILEPWQMDTEHLVNALNMCIRNSQQLLLRQAIAAVGFAKVTRNPKAEQMAWDDANYAMGAVMDVQALRLFALHRWPVTRLMEREVIRRRLTALVYH